MKLLVVSISPHNLERGALWFAQNQAQIRKARLSNPWWRDNALFLERDLVIKPSLLVRRLTDMGYERAGIAAAKGLFAARGGIVEIWPVNEACAYAVEFSGNAIVAIHQKESPATEAKPNRRRNLVSVEKSVESLAEGSFVVHVDHGIGILREVQNGFYVIEYAPPAPGRAPDCLFVPTDQKNRLTSYVGFTTPAIHRLGGSFWSKTKRRAREDAEKLAGSLLALYARRHAAKREAHLIEDAFLGELRATFPFEETPDQERTLVSIMRDLAAGHPMDRLVVGDVGFGKTEIAVRAAAAVISGGKQAALLAPTTVLASQHEATLRARFGSLPIKVRMLSRLTPLHEQKLTLKEIANGKTDCIVGTHRLLSSDVSFKNLGLVIIDEEQRFGVRQKERFKELRAGVDILSLSATPIPRTLSLALAGLRDVSQISTPPPGRIPIATNVLPYGQKIIREAIRYELARGGQIYFLHNRIETIGSVKERLAQLLKEKTPTLSFSYDRNEMIVRRDAPRIGVVHGRMSERELVSVMDRFRNREIDILLATTIIENGLDISSANTLIVDDAARLGLAQAHQLRGRIGRGTNQAFAYFLYKPRRLTEKAAERLKALKEYADLGSGYQIALRDLEIRGAGNVLGREQAGAINKVGLNLYCQVLAEAVEEARCELSNASASLTL